MTTRYAILDTPLGGLTAVIDRSRTGEGEVLIGLYFPGRWSRSARTGEVLQVCVDDEPLLQRVSEQLTEYFAGTRRDFDLPLELRGGEHHRRVWDLIAAIPYGQTVTYGDLARETGGVAQAVGGAVGGNPISVIVPCHRVVGSDGSLTGFGGGLDRKRALLTLEEPDAEDRGALF